MNTSNIRKGIIGSFYDSSPRTCVSFFCDDSLGIPIGFPVMRGTNLETQCKRFNGGVSTEILGVAAFSHLVTTGSYSPTYKQSYYPQYAPVTILKEGRMWIPIYGGQTIGVGDTAYIDTLYDRITNTKVINQTVPIGRFLTGGTSQLDDSVLFVLELIPGFEEEPDATLRKAEVLTSKLENSDVNFKKSKKENK